MDNTINSQLSFRANIDGKFLNAADALLRNQPPKLYKQFNSAVRRFIELPKSDHITISYKKEFRNGQPMHILYADGAGKKPVVLAAKDQFRKLIQKFAFMNEYEFKIKTGLIKKEAN